jgi:hypothetical protein
MTARPLDLLALLVGLALTAAGLAATGPGLATAVGRLAPDGNIEFFGPERMAQVRWALVAGGVMLAVLPWLWRSTGGEPRPIDVPHARPLLGLLVVAFVAASLARTVEAPPSTTDAKYYLAEALDIQAKGGALALPGRLFRGEYLESNRHPAYLAGLAPVAESSGRFVERARWLTLAGAVLSLLLLYRLVARRWGSGCGLVAASLLALGASFRFYAVAVACEPWFLAASLAWFDLATRGSRTRRLGDMAVLGGLAALAWLIKGTGLVLLMATIVVSLVERGRGAWREWLVAAGAFVLIGSPLLVRNLRVHGNPLFNVNTSRAMWLDDYHEFRNPAALGSAGPGHYLATHSGGDVALRWVSGVPKTASDLLDALAPVVPQMALGLPLLVLALLGLRRRPPREGSTVRLVLAVVLLPYLASLAWYARIANGDRFTLVVAPLLLGPAAWAILRVLPRARSGGLAPGGIAAASALGLLVAAWAGGLGRWRPGSFEPSPVQAEVGAWLRVHIGEHSHLGYAMGPTRGLDFDWDLAIRGDRHPLPAGPRDLAHLSSLPWGQELRAVVVDRDGLDRTGCPWACWEGQQGLVPDRPPDGWTVAARFPATCPQVLIFAPGEGQADLP